METTFTKMKNLKSVTTKLQIDVEIKWKKDQPFLFISLLPGYHTANFKPLFKLFIWPSLHIKDLDSVLIQQTLFDLNLIKQAVETLTKSNFK